MFLQNRCFIVVEILLNIMESWSTFVKSEIPIANNRGKLDPGWLDAGDDNADWFSSSQPSMSMWKALSDGSSAETRLTGREKCKNLQSRT